MIPPMQVLDFYIQASPKSLATMEQRMAERRHIPEWWGHRYEALTGIRVSVWPDSAGELHMQVGPVFCPRHRDPDDLSEHVVMFWVNAEDNVPALRLSQRLNLPWHVMNDPSVPHEQAVQYALIHACKEAS